MNIPQMQQSSSQQQDGLHPQQVQQVVPILMTQQLNFFSLYFISSRK